MTQAMVCSGCQKYYGSQYNKKQNVIIKHVMIVETRTI